MAASASLSEPKSWKSASPPAIETIVTPLDPAANSAADEHDVDDAEQEHHDDHPDLEAGVLAE